MFRILMIIVAVTMYSIPLLAKSENRILVIGDSLTEGYKMSKKDSWPSLIQDKLKNSKKFSFEAS